jgi:hypothetical protein
MAQGRPGGNPDLVKHQYTTERAEPCSDRIQIRMPSSLVERIKSIPDWPEWARKTLAENIKDNG